MKYPTPRVARPAPASPASPLPDSPPALRRRTWLAGALGAFATPLLAAPGARADALANLRVVQLLDTSPDQQELSRDYSSGVRLAFAQIKQAGGRTPQLVSIDIDGSAAALREALQKTRSDPSQIALLGAVGGRLAAQSVATARELSLDIAHVAPWLADSRFDAEPAVFPIFASRDAQIRHAIAALAVAGVNELGLVYTSRREEEAADADIAAIAARLKLRTRRLAVAPGQDIAAFAAALPRDTPAFLLFLGGSIELAQFTQGLAKQTLARYIICLSDVDTTTLMQLGPGKSASLIFAQVVPNPQAASVPVVRSYRHALKALFDEPPSPVSLAGYLAGRYAAQVLAASEGTPSRASVLAEFQRRRSVDLDGYRIEFAKGGRGSNYVSQTLLGSDGRLIG